MNCIISVFFITAFNCLINVAGDEEPPLFKIFVLIMTASSPEEIKKVIEIIDEVERSGKPIDLEAKKGIDIARANIKSFLMLDLKSQKKFFELKIDLFGSSTLMGPKRDNANIYSSLLKKESEISALIPGQPLLVFFCTHRRMGSGAAYEPHLVKEDEITKSLEAYSSEFGADSPFFADLLLVLMKKRMLAGRYGDAIKMYNQVYDRMEKFAGLGSRRMLVLKICLLKSLIEIKEIKKATELFRQLDVNEITTRCEELHYDLYLFCKSVAYIYEVEGKLKTSASYQDAAFSNLAVIRHDSDPDLIAEAEALREILAKTKEFKQLRKIEDRFNLKKKPRYADER